jgi:hypothetical protein
MVQNTLPTLELDLDRTIRLLDCGGHRIVRIQASRGWLPPGTHVTAARLQHGDLTLYTQDGYAVVSGPVRRATRCGETISLWTGPGSNPQCPLELQCLWSDPDALTDLQLDDMRGRG